MQIVLEGPDNAGKSTLAAFLSERLGIPVKHSGGPSKYPGEVNARALEFNRDTSDLIYDRHPCVSQNVYQDALQAGGEYVEQQHLDAFYAGKPLIIYCKSLGNLDGHRMTDHSSPEYFDQVERNYNALCNLYDLWAVEHANLIYRIGDSMEDVANTCAAVYYSANDLGPNVGDEYTDMWADIIEFHRRFQQEYIGKPRHLPPDLMRFRRKFMMEELGEYQESSDAAEGQFVNGAVHGATWDEADFVFQLEKQADSLVDLVYVALGTAHLQGFNFPEMWRRVHAANMRKVLAMENGVAAPDVTDSGRDKRFDVVKPAGWEPPSHTDLIEDHAHR